MQFPPLFTFLLHNMQRLTASIREISIFPPPLTSGSLAVFFLRGMTHFGKSPSADLTKVELRPEYNKNACFHTFTTQSHHVTIQRITGFQKRFFFGSYFFAKKIQPNDSANVFGSLETKAPVPPF